MDNETLHIETLDLIVAPCFCVKAGRIFQCNAAAKHLPLPLGAEIAPLLATGQEEYTAYEGGSLYLTLDLSGTVFGAEVERRGAGLFRAGGPCGTQGAPGSFSGRHRAAAASLRHSGLCSGPGEPGRGRRLAAGCSAEPGSCPGSASGGQYVRRIFRHKPPGPCGNHRYFPGDF